MSGLTATHVTVRYGRRTVLDDLSVGPLPAGAVSALLGPNGSGKSTLLRALAGIEPSGATVRFGELELSRMRLAARARHCVYLPQALPPPVHLQVLESVIAARRAAAPAGDWEDDEVSEALEVLGRLGVDELALRYMDELSGGQRQLVGLAQALVRQPEILLLDEPLSALDLHHQFAVMKFVRQETRARGMVTVVVLHDLNIALQQADHVVMLRRGRIEGAGDAREVITTPMLHQVYGVRARVETCSRGRPHVVVDGVD
ncbi:iron ABC transporter ATP-binding protein [Gluconacetobacter johannae DSM 13595]|uniref:ABC transporter ATP-binding protein n=1 Tax=Gluconacetobacter johannae TaxID=112140 RepID=A0A7W4J4L0_9PROT|nr:ABC transporter ATP-binding protein [Gluconacetobacter johannae]MBB2174544.1 ABC transporter ATP-binding protein [Gluconacetobacter johannae]GBQ84460.1 iron ABC transporter ATP-binding protein [Gluconacetobacter johannae DSM 13595]